MPASSKRDPLLAKAESISNSGSSSVITYLGRRKKPAGGERSENMGETQLCRHQSLQRFSPAACDEDHGEAG